MGAAPFGFKGAGFSACVIHSRGFTAEATCISSLSVATIAFLSWGTPKARNDFVETLDQIRLRHKFHLYGYVVMPEHVHLLIDEAGSVNPSIVLQVVKQNAARRLGTGLEKSFWQRRFYDFNTWSSGKLREKLNYMHANPVKRGLVSHPEEWVWSSWLHYAKGVEGILQIDSLSELGGRYPEELGMDGEEEEEEEKNPHP